MEEDSIGLQSSFEDEFFLPANCSNCSAHSEDGLYEDGDHKLGVLTVPNPSEFKYPWISNRHFYPNILTFMVTLLIGLFGNVVVIAVMTGDRKSHTTTNVFLVSLAVADLLMLSVCVPLETIELFVVLLNFGGAACRVGHYFMMLSFTASVLNLTAVSLERFIVIVFPMKSRSLCTMNNCRRSVFLVWFLSIILACPVITVVEEESIIYSNPNRTEEVTAYYCKDVDSLVFPTYRLLVLFGIPAVLMIVFYAAVIRELWKSTKNIAILTSCSVNRSYSEHTPLSGLPNDGETYYSSPHSAGSRSGLTSNFSNGLMPLNASDSRLSRSPTPVHVTFKQKGRPFICSAIVGKKPREKGEDLRRTRRQVIKMLIVVVLLFILCWGPTIITEMLIGLGMQAFTQEFYVFKWVSSLLPFVHCCINPVIYCFMSKNIRTSMTRVITAPCRPCHRPPFRRSDYSHPKYSPGRATHSRMSTSFGPDATTANTEIEISAV